MKLLGLELYNFGIFKGTTKLSFKNKDIIGILAEYENDKARSNRSGKSLLLEAIKYNLTGWVRGKKEIDLIHTGEEYLLVVGHYIDDDGNKYVITRGRDHKNKGTLELNWIEKSKESQVAINELFGISEEDFDLMNFFKQQDIHGFMDKSPSEKTEYLMKWMNNRHWEEKETMAKKDRDLIKSELKENELIKKTLESSMEVSDDLKVTLKANKDALKSLVKVKELKITKTNKLSDSLRLLKEKKKGASSKIIDIKSKLANIGSKLESSKEIEKDLLRMKAELAKAKANIIEGSKEQTKVVITNISNYKVKIKEIETLLISTKEAKGICPILKTECDSISFNQKDIEKYDVKKDHYKAKLKEAEGQLEELELSNEQIEEYERVKHKIQAKRSILENLDVEELNTELKEWNQKLSDELENLNLDFTEQQKELDELNDTLDEIETEEKNLEKQITTTELRLNEADKALAKIDEIAKANEELRTKLEDLNYICLMFGKNGIPADEIENAFVEVENNINYILEELDCGLTVSFSPDKVLDKYEPICHCGFHFPKNYRAKDCEECHSPRELQRKNEISLKILENGVEKDFRLDSGGGKTLVSYAVRIALTMLKRQQSKGKLDILFLDEVDTALDPHLTSQIISSITRVLTKKLGYSQILLVSHKEEIKNSVPHILKVTRKEGAYSTVAFI